MRVPTFYFITNKRSENVNTFILQDIRSLLEEGFNQEMKLENITTDFEKTKINAIKTIFPNIKRTGC